MKLKVLLLAGSVLLAFVVSETLVRLLVDPPSYPEAKPRGFFIGASRELGWDLKAGVEGYWANGECLGHVITDQLGNRMNSREGTWDPSFENLLFIGDSNTAGLEVANQETLPAVLERELRNRGRRVNVLNLGVLGFGTDQSVRKALLQAERHRPRQILYLYSDNDFYENNVVRQPLLRFGKGAYLREGETFVEHNYPVPEYPPGFSSAVLLDAQGSASIYEDLREPAELLPPSGMRQRFRSVHSLRALLDWYGAPLDRRIRHWRHQRADPFEVMSRPDTHPFDVFLALVFSAADGGFGRIAHREYYDAQLTFLLRELRRIPSVERVHLVQFVGEITLELMDRGRPSTNRQLFESLLQRGDIDSYVDLNRVLRDQGLKHRSFTCPKGDHYTAAGYRWAADAILEQINFGAVR